MTFSVCAGLGRGRRLNVHGCPGGRGEVVADREARPDNRDRHDGPAERADERVRPAFLALVEDDDRRRAGCHRVRRLVLERARAALDQRHVARGEAARSRPSRSPRSSWAWQSAAGRGRQPGTSAPITSPLPEYSIVKKSGALDVDRRVRSGLFEHRRGGFLEERKRERLAAHRVAGCNELLDDVVGRLVVTRGAGVRACPRSRSAISCSSCLVLADAVYGDGIPERLRVDADRPSVPRARPRQLPRRTPRREGRIFVSSDLP